MAEKSKQYGMHVEVITNIIPTLNDIDSQLNAIASWIKNSLGEDTPWHVTRFHPRPELSHLVPTPVSMLEPQDLFACKKPGPLGQVTDHWLCLEK